MKLFKLIKSIDYVTYPAYKELVKISDAVGNSVTAFRDMLISTIAGVIFDITPISGIIVSYIKEQFPNPDTLINQIASYENAPQLVSILGAVIIFGFINLIHFIVSRWGSNKNSKKKRDIIVYEFYNVAIPQLIEVKSILEQMKDDDSEEERKKLLLLLQAKHEICDLYQLVSQMRVLEKDKTGLQTLHSSDLSNPLSMYAYHTFLSEMLEILFEIFVELSEHHKDNAKSDIDDIKASINKADVFGQDHNLTTRLEKIRDIINGKEQTQEHSLH